MLWLILAILCSTMSSLVMRLSADRIKGNASMLAVNYFICLCISVLFTGAENLLPQHSELPRTLLMGGINGVLFLAGFLTFQTSVKKSGVVLSSIFMKLGLLVPMAVSMVVFGELPDGMRIIGFVLVVAAILMINLRSGEETLNFGAGLFLVLLTNGCADAMSKIFDELGCAQLSSQYFLYTFVVALLLSVLLAAARKERPGAPELIFGVVLGIPNYFCARLLLKSLESLSAVIAYPSFSVGTLFLVTLGGVLLFRERLSRRQWFALGVILVALVILNI